MGITEKEKNTCNPRGVEVARDTDENLN